jgi:hypothetical protein
MIARSKGKNIAPTVRARVAPLAEGVTAGDSAIWVAAGVGFPGRPGSAEVNDH